MNIRPDNINFLSTLPNYINLTYDTGAPTGTISVSGSIGIGATLTFSTVITTSSQNTRSDVYGVNSNTGIKQLLSNTGYPTIFQKTGAEKVNVYIDYAATSLTVSIVVVNNTGAPILLTTQSIVVTVVEYQIPF